MVRPLSSWGSQAVLKYRLLTAIVLIPLVILGTLFTSTDTFAAAVTVVIGLAAWEWSALAGIRIITLRVMYTCIMLATCLIFYIVSPLDAYIEIGVKIVALLWLLLAIFLMLNPIGTLSTISKSNYRMISILLGTVLLLATWASFIRLHGLADGPELIVALFLLVWAADSGAFFAGRKWGKHKLAPLISPAKTREGAIGGIILALIVAGITPYILEIEMVNPVKYLPLALVSVVFSICGDLLESTFKRVQQIKDSGRLLPGHGGVLDRIDSMLAASPIYLCGLLLLGNSA